ncbi:phage tail tape measure protein [Lelliottia wanjuensis]|uniref:phage tail tape measure protein n=1 Tax=Lelliottia wanjuensis TaxID=3050585 RepID=UPI00254F03ED|nr:phage tail tape measure protein [Lelliottia sp. V106_16]MDK9356716.1 phage tail tape measure protein [Lelliottia sp. V106_16]
MSDSFQLKAIISGVDKLSPMLSGISKNMQKNLKSLSSIGMKAGAGLIAGITSTSIAFAQQETAVTDLKVSMMDSSGNVVPEFKKISDMAIQLGNKLPGSTSDFVEMMNALVKQGVPVQNILNGVGEATAYMAVQMHMAPAEMAESMAKLQDATSTASQDMLKLADATQRAFYMGVELDNSIQFFSKASPILGMVAKDGEKAAEAMEPLNIMLNQAGMAGEAAGNAIRKAFQGGANLKKMHEISGALGKRGIHLQFFSKQGQFLGVENFISQMEKLKQLDPVTFAKVIKKGWGEDAETQQALQVVMNKGLKGYKATQKAMASQADLHQRVEASLGTLSNMWDAMTGSATNAAASIGQVFAPQVKKITETVGNLAVKFDGWAQNNPQTVKSIAAVAGAIAGVAIAIKIVNGALFLLEANPVVAGILAIAAAAAYLAMNWDDVRKAAAQMWKEMKDIGAKFGDIFKDIGSHIAETFSQYISGPITAAFDSMWEKIKEHTPDFIIKLLAKMDTPDTSVRGAPTPRINPGNPISTTIPPMPDYTRSGPQQGKSEVVVRFENTPAGTRVSDSNTSGPVTTTTSVGYSRFSSQYANAMTGR